MGSETIQIKSAVNTEVEPTNVGAVTKLIHKQAKTLAEQRAELLYQLNHKLEAASISRANLILRSSQQEQLTSCDKKIQELRSEVGTKTTSSDILQNFDQTVSYYQDVKLLQLVSKNVCNLGRDIQEARGVLGNGDPKKAIERYQSYINSLSELLKRNPSFREILDDHCQKAQKEILTSMEKGIKVAHELKQYFDAYSFSGDGFKESIRKLSSYELKYMKAAFKQQTNIDISQAIQDKFIWEKEYLELADVAGKYNNLRAWEISVDITEFSKRQLLVKSTADILSNNHLGSTVNNILGSESLPQLLNSLINLNTLPEKDKQEVLSILKQETRGDIFGYLRKNNKININHDEAEVFLNKLCQSDPKNLSSGWGNFLSNQVREFSIAIGKEESQLNPNRETINLLNNQLQEIVNLSQRFGISIDLEQLEKTKLQFVLGAQAEGIKLFVNEKYKNPELSQLSKHLDLSQQKALMERTEAEVAAYLESKKSFIKLFPDLSKEIKEAERLGINEGRASSQKISEACRGFRKLYDHWEWGNGELINISKGLNKQEYALLQSYWIKQYGTDFLTDMLAEVGDSADYKILVCRTEGKVTEALAIEASSHISDPDYLEKNVLPLLNPENIASFDQEFSKLLPSHAIPRKGQTWLVPKNFTEVINNKITDHKNSGLINAIYNLAHSKEDNFLQLRAEVDKARFFKYFYNSKGEECARFLNQISSCGSEGYELIYRGDPNKLLEKLKLDGVDERGYVDTARLDAFITACGGEKNLNQIFDQEKIKVDISAYLNDAQVEWCRSMILADNAGKRNANKFKEHIVALRYAGYDKYTFGWGADEDLIKENFVLNDKIFANITTNEQKEYFLSRQKAYNRRFFEFSEFSAEAQEIIKNELDEWDQKLTADRRINGELSECGQVCEALGRPGWWNGTNSAIVRNIVRHKNSKQLSQFDTELQNYLSEMGYQSLVKTWVSKNEKSADSKSAAPLLKGWLIEEGEEKVETELLLAGRPETLKQFQDAAKKRFEYYKSSWQIGNYWAGNSIEMEKDYQLFQNYLASTEKNKLTPGTAEWRKMESLYQNFQVSAGQCREDNEIFTQRIATTATIVVAVGTSWATAGQSLWLIALVSGSSAFTANSLTHMMLDGDTYTGEEMFEHLAFAGVEGISLGTGTKVGLYFAKKLLLKKTLIIAAERGAMQLSSKGFNLLTQQAGIKGLQLAETAILKEGEKAVAVKVTKEMIQQGVLGKLFKQGLIREVGEDGVIHLTTKGLDRLANSSYAVSLLNNITQSSSGEFLAGNIHGARVLFTDNKTPSEVLQEMLANGMQRAAIGSVAALGFTTLFNVPGILRGNKNAINENAKNAARENTRNIIAKVRASALTDTPAPNTISIKKNTPVREVSQFELHYKYKNRTGKVAEGDFRGWYDGVDDCIYVNKSLSSAEKKAVVAHELRHKWSGLFVKGKDADLNTIRNNEIRAQFQEEIALRSQGQRRKFNRDGSFTPEQIPTEELAKKLTILDKIRIYNDIVKHVRINYPDEFLVTARNDLIAAAFLRSKHKSLIKSLEALGFGANDFIDADTVANKLAAAITNCNGNRSLLKTINKHYNRIIKSGELNKSLPADHVITKSAEDLYDQMIKNCDILGSSCSGLPLVSLTPSKLKPKVIAAKFEKIKKEFVDRFIRENERVEGGVFKQILTNSTTASQRTQLDECLVALRLKLNDGGISLDRCKPTYKQLKAAQIEAEKRAKVKLLGPELKKELDKIKYISNRIDEIAAITNPKLAAATKAKKDLLELCEQFPKKKHFSMLPEHFGAPGVTAGELTKKIAYYSTFPILHPLQTVGSVLNFLWVRGWQAFYILPPKTGTMLAQWSESLGNVCNRIGFTSGANRFYDTSLVLKQNGFFGSILKVPFALLGFNRLAPAYKRTFYDLPTSKLAIKAESLRNRGNVLRADLLKSYAQSINDSGYVIASIKFPFKLILVDVPRHFNLNKPGAWVINKGRNIGTAVSNYPGDKLKEFSAYLSSKNKLSFFRENRIQRGKKEFIEQFKEKYQAYTIFKKLQALDLSLNVNSIPVEKVTMLQYVKEVAIWFFISPAILVVGTELIITFPLVWFSKSDMFSNKLRDWGFKVPKDKIDNRNSFLEAASELPGYTINRLQEFYQEGEFKRFRMLPIYVYNLFTSEEVWNEAKELIKENTTHVKQMKKAWWDKKDFRKASENAPKEREEALKALQEKEDAAARALQGAETQQPNQNQPIAPAPDGNLSPWKKEEERVKKQQVEDATKGFHKSKFIKPEKIEEDPELKGQGEMGLLEEGRSKIFPTLLPKPIIKEQKKLA